MRIEGEKFWLQKIDDCWDCMDKGSCGDILIMKSCKKPKNVIVEDCEDYKQPPSLYSTNHPNAMRGE